jgi:TetR/AcrR family transcriptional regulator, regulator of cefoperazone and chloramphenicol sensitivity
MDTSNSREKILRAVIDIIGREKNMQPTVREIAARAEVNAAAINYYFQTKENLFSEAESVLARKLMENYLILDDHSMPAERRLFCWAEAMMQFLIEYPGVLLVLGIKVFEKDSRDLSIFITAAEEKLWTVIAEAAGPEKKDDFAIKVQQVMACVIYPVLIQSGIGNDKTLDLKEADQRKKYLESTFRCILSE